MLFTVDAGELIGLAILGGLLCYGLYLMSKGEQVKQEVTAMEKVAIEFTKEEFDKIIAYMDQIKAETVQDAIEHAIDLLLAVD